MQPLREKLSKLDTPENREKLDQVKTQLHKAFTEHPAATGETYWEHLRFTIGMTSRLVFTAVVLFIHGVLPFIFLRTASLQIEKIYGIMRSRIPKARLEQIETNFDI